MGRTAEEEAAGMGPRCIGDEGRVPIPDPERFIEEGTLLLETYDGRCAVLLDG